MKFLVDQNLPTGLLAVLSALGYECFHIKRLGLAQADDADIWALAGASGFIIVTKDTDFLTLARRDPDGPGVVRFTRENCSNIDLYEIVRRDWADVVKRLSTGAKRVDIPTRP